METLQIDTEIEEYIQLKLKSSQFQYVWQIFNGSFKNFFVVIYIYSDWMDIDGTVRTAVTEGTLVTDLTVLAGETSRTAVTEGGDWWDSKDSSYWRDISDQFDSSDWMNAKDSSDWRDIGYWFDSSDWWDSKDSGDWWDIDAY